MVAVIKALRPFAGFLSLGLCLSMCSCDNEGWQRRYEERASADFYKSRSTYQAIINAWGQLYPSECGGPGPQPGLLEVESITADGDGTYTVNKNGRVRQHLGINAIAEQLKVPVHYVDSITTAMTSLGSPQVRQSGAIISIVDRRNDTHGILHIKSVCPEFLILESWSKYKWNPSADPYTRLRHLGDGWYYYVEQR